MPRSVRVLSVGRNRRRLPLAIGLAAAPALLLAVVLLLSGCGSGVLTSKYDRVEESMPQADVVQILGPPTRSNKSLEHLGMADLVVDVLEWEVAGSSETVRIHFVDGKVVSKTLNQ